MIKLLYEQNTNDESSYIQVRSKLRAIMHRMELPEVQRGQAELVCMEMLTNQYKHAAHTGIFQLWESQHPIPVLDFFALDFGPGINNMSLAREDGYSTADTLGKGLGTILRLAKNAEIYSLSSDIKHAYWHGTAVWARFCIDERSCNKCTHCDYEFGGFMRAYRDDLHNGDAIHLHTSKNSVRWLHVDGLGHGKEAAYAAQHIFKCPLSSDDDPVAVLEAVSKSMRDSRGAVGVLGGLNAVQRSVQLCGIGDMLSAIIGEQGRQAISFPSGVLGHAHRSFSTTQHSLPANELMITASDGMRRNWDAQTFPGLWSYHPQMVALFLGNVMGKINDDKSIFVLRVPH